MIRKNHGQQEVPQSSRLRICGRQQNVMIVLVVLVLFVFEQPCQSFSHVLQRKKRAVSFLQSTYPNNIEKIQSNEDKAIVEFVYSPTNTTVTVIGCLHGASSSSMDVQRILQQNKEQQSTMIVLELCASRFANIRRELSSSSSSTSSSSRNVLERWNNFWSLIGTTMERKGISTGIAAAILGSVSAIQGILSSQTNMPGMEFITAIQYAQQHPKTTHILLADRTVDETLSRIATFQDAIHYNHTTILQLSQQLQIAIWGNTTTTTLPQVNMGQALTRNTNVIQDLIRLSLPPFVVAEGIALLFQTIIDTTLESFHATNNNNMIMSMTTTTMTDIAWDVGMSTVVLILAYVFIALPAAKLILFERDEQLANGIQSACQIASKQKDCRVVAVVGLLHVNGIVQKLLL